MGVICPQLSRQCPIGTTGRRRQMVNYLGWAIWELRHQFQLATHRLNVAAQRGQQHVAALLQARNGVLPDAQGDRQILLGLRNGLAQILLGGQVAGTRFHRCPALCGQISHYLVKFSCHAVAPWKTPSTMRGPSNRSSATAIRRL